MIEYVLCYAWSFTMGAAVGGAIVWYFLTQQNNKNVKSN